MSLVSIIIPCYNQGAYIQDAIDSVIAQTYANWEIIIVDDGSTEIETINKINELTAKGYNTIKINNSGVSTARNIGIVNAKGDYILPLDADDKIATQYLQDAITILQKNTKVNVVYCNCEYFGNENGLMKLPSFSMKGILFQNLVFNAGVLRKSVCDAIGGYDEAFKIGWEDWDFWLRYITNEEQVYKLHSTFFYYRIKEISRNSNLIDENRKKCEQQLFKKHIDKYITLFENPITYIQSFDFYKSEYNNLEKYRKQLHKSISYRLGNFLLQPLKWLKKLINGK